MAYQSCPKCGSINRADATHCYQCETALDAPPPPPPPTPVVQAQVPEAFTGADLERPPIGEMTASNRPKPRDLESRYQKKVLPNMESNLLHGLRSGPLAGLIAGAIMGMYRNYTQDETARLLVRQFKIPEHGMPMMVYSLGVDIIFGILLACLLGMVNMLCYTPESSRAGAVVGALTAGVLVWYVDGSYANVVVGLIHGLVVGWLASWFECKMFRGI